ncbi:DUF3857 domain-containing protein [Cellulophaga sp. HaHaR_3_176]|uniref:DUF3857 domain-containing protein n=1 Tax=Cellulophaga sp. HaHaR_3_176 TaxID=1942464 RepID=UPI001C2008FE|nr:DUF3857 domain-containing protein [Cellulophaga sp. HaHaR_3_176]QWX84177.1 DUF3857 domain-containing protein [Cellulophaga sp. HaHaR_3_176]
MRFSLFAACIFICQIITSQDLNYQSLIIDKKLTENANAVVRLDDVTVTINSIKEMVVTERRVVTVLNKLGNSSVHAREWYNDSEKIKNIQALVYDRFGKEIDKIKEKDFKDVSAVSGGTLYSDSRVKYLDYTPVGYPYTIEFNVETITSNTGAVPGFYFLDNFLVSSEQSKYIINFPSQELKPIIKEKNFGDLNISKSETSNSITYISKKIPAIRKEALSPNFKSIMPSVIPRMVNFSYGDYIGKIENWNDVSIWMYSNLLKGQDELSEGTKNKAHSLVSGIDDDLEKAKIIYKYVQENTRYISVQIGIGGLQPISAIEVDRVKFGDCKGLSNYTKALLKEVGVISYYTHVESGVDKISFEIDFPSLGAGDHVILAIPYNDQFYWIDCTSQIHPFGFIGDFTDDRQVLVIKPDGGELVTTTSYINEQNSQTIKGEYTIADDNSLKATFYIKTKGIQYDNRFSMEYDTKEDVVAYYKDNWSNVNNLLIDEFSFENDKNQIEFTEKLNVSATNYTSKSGDRILFAFNAFNKNKYVPKRYRNRKLPFKINRGYLDEDEFVIHLPEGFTIEAMPSIKTIKNEFGSYILSFKTLEEGKTIQYNRKLLIKEGEYTKDEYEEYRNFRKEIASTDNSKIVLIKI